MGSEGTCSRWCHKHTRSPLLSAGQREVLLVSVEGGVVWSGLTLRCGPSRCERRDACGPDPESSPRGSCIVLRQRKQGWFFFVCIGSSWCSTRLTAWTNPFTLYMLNIIQGHGGNLRCYADDMQLIDSRHVSKT